MTISAILLSGGTGSRMGEPVPKQYLSLCNKPIILYSLDALLLYPSFEEVVVVCDPTYQPLFSDSKGASLTFALPGKTRQDSLFSGFSALKKIPDLICIHDGARPFLRKKELEDVILAGKKYGAAALAVPTSSTIKEVDDHFFVKKTLSRSHLWTIQTPQILTSDLLIRGQKYVQEHGLLVTDDVGLAELLNHPVKLVPGKESNIKITTKQDLHLAKLFLENPYD